MLISTPHLTTVSCPLSMCLIRCSFSRICCREFLGPSKTLNLASILHARFWKNGLIFSDGWSFLLVGTVLGLKAGWLGPRQQRSRGDKNQAVSGSIMRSLGNGGPQVGEGNSTRKSMDRVEEEQSPEQQIQFPEPHHCPGILHLAVLVPL